jgi:hypothetical protein
MKSYTGSHPLCHRTCVIDRFPCIAQKCANAGTYLEIFAPMIASLFSRTHVHCDYG